MKKQFIGKKIKTSGGETVYELLSPFAKGSKKEFRSSGVCVIYTRVSTKEQADNNLSLETQRKACELYANRNGLKIAGFFGGTYESAKTDERKEFNHMLSFVKRSKEKISTIIVYSIDRFSRSGTNAMYISEQLKKEGIVIYAVTQPTDATTTSGTLQQNIQFIFSEYDNQLRREKSMAGTKEQLLRGEWCSAPPVGYDIVRKNGKRMIVINEKGKLVKMAFLWKLNDRLTHDEIAQRLTARGLKTNKFRIGEMLRNPFYCGLLAHSALEGELVEGNHERIVSKEVFLQVNGILAKHNNGKRHADTNDRVPLKRFIRCEECGAHLRGYKSTKVGHYYYKCNTTGCKCNKRSDQLHEVIRKELDKYSLPVTEDVATLIQKEITALFYQYNQEMDDSRAQLTSQLTEINRKLERLEVRFIEEEIDRAMFVKYRDQYSNEQRRIELELSKAGKQVSNLEDCINTAINFGPKLSSMWDSGRYNQQNKLLFLVFPEGMTYDRKTDKCRTPRINAVFGYLSTLTRITADVQQEDSGDILYNYASDMVSGVEP